MESHLAGNCSADLGSEVEQEESSDGMLPSREFMLRSRFWSSFRKPSSDGMPPWKLLFDSCSLVREVMLAIQGDIEPMMPSDGRSMAITRRGALLPVAG